MTSIHLHCVQDLNILQVHFNLSSLRYYIIESKKKHMLIYNDSEKDGKWNDIIS